MPWAVELLAGAAVVVTVLGTVALRVRLGTTRDPRWFRCRLAATPRRGRRARGGRRAWGRTARATWRRDVLLVRSGVLQLRTASYRVRTPAAGPRPVPARDVRRLGDRPLVLPLVLTTGKRVELAAPAESRDLLVGPFLVLAVEDLPPAPRGGLPSAGGGAGRPHREEPPAGGQRAPGGDQS
ncbi:hypothetical protein [Geodermatophilus marinus]|uniref:hypothetical protein n=1 Tax=Geodermatophilus sp. LHW52908 TaxID=2303986 RepID=UPI000E3EE45D|nr:hypothetical protein [Geodermatophilus sp. LHW52908]RFU22026.1 hypothetical protein D0Z06_07835 [Geodermatophilus sp. LHW52908]